jgi:hypothetical protein
MVATSPTIGKSEIKIIGQFGRRYVQRIEPDQVVLLELQKYVLTSRRRRRSTRPRAGDLPDRGQAVTVKER